MHCIYNKQLGEKEEEKKKQNKTRQKGDTDSFGYMTTTEDV